MVGGAVMTQDYADRIGADSYAKDAMGAVRYAERLFSDEQWNKLDTASVIYN